MGEGAIVRVRDKKNPDPPVFDYSKEEPWNVETGEPAPVRGLP
jgi:hypothetical protein